jgi:hypothetical protein
MNIRESSRAFCVMVLIAATATTLNAGGQRDYPLSARVISVTPGQSTQSANTAASSQSGVSLGAGYSGAPDHEEVEIDGKIYTTEILSRGSTSGHIGDSLPAAFGKQHGINVIYLLGKDKNGKPREITLKIIDQRTAP